VFYNVLALMVFTMSAHIMEGDRHDPVLFPDIDVEAADVAMLREVLGGLAGQSVVIGIYLVV
jgi:hypothetical protein